MLISLDHIFPKMRTKSLVTPADKCKDDKTSKEAISLLLAAGKKFKFPMHGERKTSCCLSYLNL